MDPSAALREAKYALKLGRINDAAEYIEAYFDWRASGGFQPARGDTDAALLWAAIEARR